MLLAGLLLAAPQVVLPPPAFPDILLLIADDVADTDLDVVYTPNIDALAARGVRFRRAYSNPLCTPTRLTMIFGEWESVLTGGGCESPPAVPPPDPTRDTLPKWLAGVGYETALFGKWHGGSNLIGPWEITPQLYGFETWRAGSPGNVTECGGSNYSNWMRVDDGVSALTGEYHTIAVRDALQSWWQAGGDRPPRFAWVGFQAPHLPLHIPPASIQGGPCGPHLLSKRDKYECMLRSLDMVVGQILAQVDLERTLVIFVADNGTPEAATRVGQSPNKVKKTTFEDGIRVPLIIAGPGVAGGRETEALAHVVDLFATIADAVELPAPPGARDSVSLWPVLSGASEQVREYVFSAFGPPTGGYKDRAVVTERWKLREAQGVQELYDLWNDPLELAPLAPAARPEVAARLLTLLQNP